MSIRMPGFIRSLLPVTSALGLEITDSALKLVHLAFPSRKDPILYSYHTEWLPQSAVDDGRILDPVTVTRAAQTALARVKTKSRDVHMVLPSQLIMVRFLKFPDIPLKDLSKLVDFEVKHQIHLPFDNPIYDFLKLNGSNEAAPKKKKPSIFSKNKPSAEDALLEAAPAKENDLDFSAIDLFGDKQASDKEAEAPKKQCDVMLVAAPQELVQEYITAVQSAGFKVKSLEFKALSLFRLAERLELSEPGETFLIVDVNEKATDLSVFHEGLLKITRSVPLTFQKRQPKQEPPPEGADALFAEFLDPDADFRNTCGDLAHELERLMNFYRYTLNNRNQEFSRLLVAGDIERLSEVAESLDSRLSLKAELISSERIEVRSGVFWSLPAYAVPIGLALREGGAP